MINYKSTTQVKIEEFQTPYEMKLSKENRWVRLSTLITWDKLAEIYYTAMSKDEGRPSIDARRIIGSLIIKHKLNLSDEETVLQIQENPYLQYFLGYDHYESKQVFSPTLFVEIRKRLGLDKFEAMNEAIIGAAYSKKEVKKKVKGQIEVEKESDTITPNKGKLIVDATVADQAIKYPNDLELLNDSRQISEGLIDTMYESGLMKKKPRTYRRRARREFLATAKKKNKTHKELRKSIRKQLNYLKRNLNLINNLIDSHKWREFPLTAKQQRQLWIIAELFRQQQEMYDENNHSCEDRIVSIIQPHVRPIVRGKVKKKVEFGAKIGVGVCDGFAKIDTLSWDAYNESEDLPKHLENYRKTFGHYPEVVLGDTIYGTKQNREYLKSKGIRFGGKPLGRPKKQTEDNKKELYEEKQKRKKDYRDRIPIEGKFGQGKNGYDLNYIRAKLPETSESWIGCIFLVMNIVNLLKRKGKKINSILNWLILEFKNYFNEIFGSKELGFVFLK